MITEATDSFLLATTYLSAVHPLQSKDVNKQNSKIEKRTHKRTPVNPLHTNH